MRSNDSESPGSKRSRPLLIAGAVLLFIGISILVGIFAYIHYTNRITSSAQDELSTAWKKAVEEGNTEDLDLQGGVARIVIPKLDVDAIVVELDGLTDDENLKRGPGHVSGTAYPGEEGNVVIACHRTTYGAMFRNIDTLEEGDEITLETLEGKFTYEVTEKKSVDPDDLSVLDQEGQPRVTLSACDPPYSAAKRYIVIGLQVSPE